MNIYVIRYSGAAFMEATDRVRIAVEHNNGDKEYLMDDLSVLVIEFSKPAPPAPLYRRSVDLPKEA